MTERWLVLVAVAACRSRTHDPPAAPPLPTPPPVHPAPSRPHVPTPAPMVLTYIDAYGLTRVVPDQIERLELASYVAPKLLGNDGEITFVDLDSLRAGPMTDVELNARFASEPVPPHTLVVLPESGFEMKLPCSARPWCRIVFPGALVELNPYDMPAVRVDNATWTWLRETAGSAPAVCISRAGATLRARRCY